MKSIVRLMPILVVLLSAGWLASSAVPPKDPEGAFAVNAFGRLPVVYQGRVKPFDTLARNTLVVLSDRQHWVDEAGNRRPAMEWLLDVMANTHRARHHKVFRIHSLDLQTQLGLERRKGYRYALDEFESKLPEVEMQAVRAGRLEPEERDVYDGKVLEFAHKVNLYRLMGETHAIPDVEGGGLNVAMQRLQMIERFSVPHAIPPRGAEEEWTPMLRAVLTGAMTGDPHPAIPALAGMLVSWGRDDTAGFNQHLAQYEEYLRAHPVPGAPKLELEAGFNNLAPFYRCSVLYVLGFLLACFAWLGWTENFRRIAFWMLLMTFVAHTAAIAARVYISGYPPITNLYGTAVFIGWGCVLLGLGLESVYKLGVGNLLSAMVGFITLLIAHFLAGDGDTLEMMQAVLDTKFWLATHVIIINFGYSATFLAGALAVVYILRGVLTKTLDAGTDKALGRMMYGILSFALLLSFLGTVLGGLWADDSWGRFWGWDPKENGALMIVLWNALILHARWGGMIRSRGIAVLSIFGSVVTAWSWFGVNQLGVGLHSYGFTESVAFWLIAFVASQLAIMALGLVPRRLWRSRTG